jgi:hypothetical protein
MIPEIASQHPALNDANTAETVGRSPQLGNSTKHMVRAHSRRDSGKTGSEKRLRKRFDVG